MLAAAKQRGADGAAFNQGTAALGAGDARSAVQWLRQALLDAPDDPAAKRNYELALELLQQQDEQQDQQQDREQQEQQQPNPAPTPTPDLSGALYAALERAEADARKEMRTPTPVASSVEKDW